MPIIRCEHDKDNPYVMISNKIALDSRISDKARGLLLRMLVNKDDWEFYIDKLSRDCQDRKTSVTSSLKELEKFNYIKIEKDRDERGQFKKREIYIYEDCDDNFL